MIFLRENYDNRRLTSFIHKLVPVRSRAGTLLLPIVLIFFTLNQVRTAFAVRA